MRDLIAAQAVGVDEIATRNGRSIHTVLSWTQGRVPKGAPPFPSEVKLAGKKVRVYCADEVDAWISRHAARKESA